MGRQLACQPIAFSEGGHGAFRRIESLVQLAEFEGDLDGDTLVRPGDFF